MARTTGFTATAAVNLVTKGIFTKKGVFPPEWIGEHNESFKWIMNYLKERHVYYQKLVE
jgi:saccharopine dehydrogenase-like NADP-dependent oxidoreductase